MIGRDLHVNEFFTVVRCRRVYVRRWCGAVVRALHLHAVSSGSNPAMTT